MRRRRTSNPNTARLHTKVRKLSRPSRRRLHVPEDLEAVNGGVPQESDRSAVERSELRPVRLHRSELPLRLVSRQLYDTCSPDTADAGHVVFKLLPVDVDVQMPLLRSSRDPMRP